MFFSKSGLETFEILSAEIVQNHVASEFFLAPATDFARYRELSTKDTSGWRAAKDVFDCVDFVDTDKSALADPSESILQLSRILDIRSDCS